MQFEDADFQGGANVVSLNQARANFREFAASERRFIQNVRPPTLEEQP
ncbi:MAG: CPCC family cysteine-rich protein [Gaiellaceae bacterium]